MKVTIQMIKHPALVGFLAGASLHVFLLASYYIRPLGSFMYGMFQYFDFSYDVFYFSSAPPAFLLAAGFLVDFPVLALFSTALMTGIIYSVLFWSLHKIVLGRSVWPVVFVVFYVAMIVWVRSLFR